MTAGGDFELRIREILSRYFHNLYSCLLRMQTARKGDADGRHVSRSAFISGVPSVSPEK
jgi:hypothetical protein